MRHAILLASVLVAGCAQGPSPGRVAQSDASDGSQTQDTTGFTLALYDVEDLFAKGPGVLEPDELEKLLVEFTGGQGYWREPASYDLHRGQLIIFQRESAHALLRYALSDLHGPSSFLRARLRG